MHTFKPRFPMLILYLTYLDLGEISEGDTEPDDKDYRSVRSSIPTVKSETYFAIQSDFEDELDEVPEELEEDGEQDYEDGAIEFEGEYDEEEGYADDEEYGGEDEPCADWVPIPVHPCLAEQLGEKSLQVTYRGEVGIDAINEFEAAKEVTDKIFEKTLCSLRPRCAVESDEDSSLDEELGDDDDSP